jgi:hypothetical protein
VVSCLIVAFFLEIKVEKNKENMFHGFKKIINPASAVFFTILCGFGMGCGVFFNYGAVYLQEEMGASSAMIGM